MFRDIKEMTTEEIEREIQSIDSFEDQFSQVNVDSMLNKKVDTSFLSSLQCTITPNGQLFRTDRKGFIPEMLENMYEDRKKFKKLMLNAKQELEDVKNQLKKKPNDSDAINREKELTRRVARYNNLQLAKKVSL